MKIGKIYGLHLKGDPDNIRYVGKTASARGLPGRLYGHVWLARNGAGKPPVQRWINKHGGENIEIRELAEAPEAELDGLEISTIKAYRETGKADLNVTPGGDGRTSEEVSGSKNPRAKATWEGVNAIRDESQERYIPLDEAARKLGVTPIGASKIMTNRSWVDPQYDPEKRITPQESAKTGGRTAWGRPTDPEVNQLRKRYLSGDTISQLTASENLPPTTLRRYLFDRYGDEELREACNRLRNS